jgi:hypothetical protein
MHTGPGTSPFNLKIISRTLPVAHTQRATRVTRVQRSASTIRPNDPERYAAVCSPVLLTYSTFGRNTP